MMSEVAGRLKQKVRQVPGRNVSHGHWAHGALAHRRQGLSCVHSGFFHKLRFQLHGANAINPAVNIMIPFNEAHDFYLGAHFNNG